MTTGDARRIRGSAGLATAAVAALSASALAGVVWLGADQMVGHSAGNGPAGLLGDLGLAPAQVDLGRTATPHPLAPSRPAAPRQVRAVTAATGTAARVPAAQAPVVAPRVPTLSFSTGVVTAGGQGSTSGLGGQGPTSGQGAQGSTSGQGAQGSGPGIGRGVGLGGNGQGSTPQSSGEAGQGSTPQSSGEAGQGNGNQGNGNQGNGQGAGNAHGNVQAIEPDDDTAEATSAVSLEAGRRWVLRLVRAEGGDLESIAALLDPALKAASPAGAPTAGRPAPATQHRLECVLVRSDPGSAAATRAAARPQGSTDQHAGGGSSDRTAAARPGAAAPAPGPAHHTGAASTRDAGSPARHDSGSTSRGSSSTATHGKGHGNGSGGKSGHRGHGGGHHKDGYAGKHRRG